MGTQSETQTGLIASGGSRRPGDTTASLLLVTRSRGLGGAEAQAVRHGEMMSEYGYSVDLLTLWPPAIAPVVSRTAHEWSFAHTNRFLAILRLATVLARSRSKYSIVQVYVSNVSLKSLSPILVLNGNRSIIAFRSGRTKFGMGRIGRRLLELVDAEVVTNSAHMVPPLQTHLPDTVVTHVPNYVLERGTESVKANVATVGEGPAETGAPASRLESLSLLSVGNLRPVKDHQVIFYAAALLRSRGVHITLTLCGAGPSELLLRSLAQRLALEVDFRGQVPRWYNLVGPHDVVIQPSLSEGSSNVLVEASVLGLPILASRIPAHTEYLRSDDGLFTASDPFRLAALLERYAADVEYRQKLEEVSLASARRFLEADPRSMWHDLYSAKLGQRGAKRT